MRPGKGNNHEIQKYVTKILKKVQGLTSGEGGKLGNGEDLEKDIASKRRGQ